MRRSGEFPEPGTNRAQRPLRVTRRVQMQCVGHFQNNRRFLQQPTTPRLGQVFDRLSTHAATPIRRW